MYHKHETKVLIDKFCKINFIPFFIYMRIRKFWNKYGKLIKETLGFTGIICKYFDWFSSSKKLFLREKMILKFFFNDVLRLK